MTERAEKPFFTKKSLGQHFLIDTGVVSRIVEACELQSGETVLEIGPGQGALTRELASRVRRVVAVETDQRLIQDLRANLPSDKVDIYHEDFLKFDLFQIPYPVKAVGNLPYYISSPIISRVIEERRFFSVLFMTVQLEFWERLAALPNSRNYGPLSVLAQFYANPKFLFRISRRSFRPVPGVNSCFIRMELRATPAVAVKNEAFFDRVVRLAFLQRRKTVLNALAGLCEKEKLKVALQKAGVSAQARAENLDISDFARLTDEIFISKGNI